MLSRIINGSSRNLNGVGSLASAGASDISLDLIRLCEVRTYHDEMQSLIEHTWRQLESLYERRLDFVRTKGCSRSWLGRRRVTRQQDRAKVDHLRQPRATFASSKIYNNMIYIMAMGLYV